LLSQLLDYLLALIRRRCEESTQPRPVLSAMRTVLRRLAAIAH